jgi:hypothetical protein
MPATELVQAQITMRRIERSAMYLDTVPAAMQSANSIYRKQGFQPVERYNTNPILGQNPTVAVVFLRIALVASTADAY